MKFDKDSIINLNEHHDFGNLRYRIAYKTVGNAPFFAKEEIRHVLWDCLDKRAIVSQVDLSDVQIFDYAIVFEITASSNLNLHSFLMRTAQDLINKVNQDFPDLDLKQMAPSGTLSRLWHRPYYIRTLDSKHCKSLFDYLK